MLEEPNRTERTEPNRTELDWTGWETEPDNLEHELNRTATWTEPTADYQTSWQSKPLFNKSLKIIEIESFGLKGTEINFSEPTSYPFLWPNPATHRYRMSHSKPKNVSKTIKNNKTRWNQSFWAQRARNRSLVGPLSANSSSFEPERRLSQLSLELQSYLAT